MRKQFKKSKIKKIHRSTQQKSKLAIILLGRPGSGKGTQADLLAKKLGLFHFEMSDFLQKIFKEKPRDSEVKKAKKQFDAGKLVSADFIVKLDIDTIKKIRQQNKGIIFDGPFRLIEEAKRGYPVLVKEYGKNNIKIFDIKISPQEAIWRNTRRKICLKCDTPIPYNSETKDLKICPIKGCGGKLITRKDDNPKIIKRRLRVFMKETQPVINYFRRQGLLIEINGEQSIPNVFKDILKKLK